MPTKEINLNMIEFKEGIYDVSQNLFFKYDKEKHEKIIKRYLTIKYVDREYKRIKKPIN
ncbi:MAG: hypothetical protein ACXVDW_20095 [Bacteroidia bacterium]